MAIWKYKLQDGWHILYGNLLSKMVRKDKNLEDLEDRSAARENLELTGDVTTHNHDSYYGPKFSALNAKTASLESRVSALETRLNAAEAEINAIKNSNNNTTNSINAINNRLSRIPEIYVQTGTPSGAPDKSIWFNLSGGSEHIKVLWQNAWRNIGAFWK